MSTRNLILALACVCLSSGAARADIRAIPIYPAVPLKSGFFMPVSQDVKAAESFIRGMTDDGLSFLADPDLTHEARKASFRKLLSARFDMPTIARFALGRYWRAATPAQQKEYLRLFEKMVIEVYAKRFSEYQGQDVKVTGARNIGEDDIVVNTLIVQKNAPEVKVDWRVRPKDGGHKIIDVIVEGVSMGVTQRSEFASVIQRGGGNVEVLLEHLRKQQ